jgi:hypothetical protein
MRALWVATALSAALFASDASAQGVNLNGRWECVTNCLGPPGSFAFITQDGYQLNLVSEAGVPSRGWIDYPGHIWLERGLGALYSNGFTIQFDNGTVWQRAPELPPPVYAPPPPPRHR